MKKESQILIFLSIILILVAWYPSPFSDFAFVSMRIISASILGFFIFYKSDKILKTNSSENKFLLQFLMFFALIHTIIMMAIISLYILFKIVFVSWIR
jgi:phosphatidylglycerophosphate synthase